MTARLLSEKFGLSANRIAGLARTGVVRREKVHLLRVIGSVSARPATEEREIPRLNARRLELCAIFVEQRSHLFFGCEAILSHIESAAIERLSFSF